MVDAVVTNVTGQHTVAAAWASLVLNTSDIVCSKVAPLAHRCSVPTRKWSRQLSMAFVKLVFSLEICHLGSRLQSFEARPGFHFFDQGGYRVMWRTQTNYDPQGLQLTSSGDRSLDLRRSIIRGDKPRFETLKPNNTKTEEGSSSLFLLSVCLCCVFFLFLFCFVCFCC